jgi:hypothetical protein
LARSQGSTRLIRTVEVFALASVVLLIAPGCIANAGATGGSNISGKQAVGIIASAIAATSNAPSVSVSVIGKTGNQTLQETSSLSASAAESSLTLGGHEIELRRIGTKIYQMAGQASLEANGLSHHDAALLANRWLEVPASDKSNYSSLNSILNLKELMKQLPPPVSSGSITNSTRSTLRGLPVYAISGTFSGEKGIFYIAAKGTPYLIRVVQPNGSNRGTLDFSNYGTPVNVQAPQNAITG